MYQKRTGDFLMGMGERFLVCATMQARDVVQLDMGRQEIEAKGDRECGYFLIIFLLVGQRA